MSDLMKWIEPCLIPLAGAACGEDVRYEDEFEAIKQALETLGGCDYDLVAVQCHQLLCNQSKDLRIMAYFLVALTYKHHQEGLLTGLHLCNELIKAFGTALHPKAPRGRASAIGWLNSSRLIGIALNIEQPDLQTAQKIADATKALNQTIKTVFSNTLPVFTALDEWLAQLLIPPKALSSDIKPSHTVEAHAQPVVIDFENKAPEIQKQLIEFWREEKNWLLSCKLARALKWHMPPPLAENGTTALPSPRKEALEMLQRLTKHPDSSPQAILEHCETVFLEPGGSLYLNLQATAHQAAVDMNEPALAAYLKAHTKWYVQQYPALVKGRFADGLSFMNQAVHAWLDEAPSSSTPHTPQTPCFQVTLQSILQDNSSLPAQLGALQDLVCQNPLQAMQRLLAKAKACQRANKEEMACIFYQELLTHIEVKHCSAWEPEKTLSAWHEAMRFLTHVSTAVLEDAKKKTLLDSIKARMCQLDAKKACLWVE